jgi:hypothetical protein
MKSPGSATLNAKQAEAVRRELESLLQSTEFRGTTRLQHCLRYLVERLLEGRSDLLKERSIGAELFQRPPDYDTGADAIVRVTANELRKKLAQYYMHAPDTEVRIELPAGSYVPEFVWRAPGEALHRETVPVAPSQEVPARAWPRVVLIAGVPALALLLVAVWFLRKPDPPLERFWAPVVRGAGPVLVCLSNPVVYGLAPEIHRSYQREHPDAANQGPYVVPLGNRLIPGSQIVPIPDQFVGNGEAFALGELTSLLTRLRKPYETRIGGDISSADLRNRAVIFLGFSSRWNLEMNKGLRFVSHIEDNLKMIRDTFVPDRAWSLPELQPDGRTSIDYALVSRVFNADTGMPILQACGITQYGCQAAGEFLSNPGYFAQVLGQLPKGWERRNLQILLTCRILRTSPGAPKVVAVHVW